MHIESSTPENYDILVIGGGINGVGIAQCSAACGHKTLLIEKNTWGSGTSSKSSKLIHGGLRYLQSGQLKMVYESLLERKRLLQLAPQLIKESSFYIPIYSTSRLKAWYICIGLFIYYLLSGFSASNRFRHLKKNEWQNFPNLKQEGLRAVLQYRDCQTDDQALTEAVAISAEKNGAICMKNTRLVSASKSGNGYAVVLESTHSQSTEQRTVNCKVLINAAGPWINELTNTLDPQPPKVVIDLIQGSHLVLEPQLSEKCFYLEAPSDGRAVFVLPWHGRTLLGTTETAHKGLADNAKLTETETNYLLEVLHHYFPNYQYEPVEHISGLRVLPRKPGSFHTRSREVVLLADKEDHPTYIAVYGGKLTTYRSTAEKVIKMAEKTLGAGTNKPSITREISF